MTRMACSTFSALMGPFRSTRTATPGAAVRRVFLDRPLGQAQGLHHFEPAGGQPLDKSQSPQFGAGELARLALADERLLRLDRVPLLQFLQAGRR